MQIQCKLRLTHLQREYLKARYEIRGKQRIHGKSLPTTKASFFPNFDKYRIYSSGINTGVLVVLRQVISSPMSNPVSLYHINDLLL